MLLSTWNLHTWLVVVFLYSSSPPLHIRLLWLPEMHPDGPLNNRTNGWVAWYQVEWRHPLSLSVPLPPSHSPSTPSMATGGVTGFGRFGLFKRTPNEWAMANTSREQWALSTGAPRT